MHLLHPLHHHHHHHHLLLLLLSLFVCMGCGGSKDVAVAGNTASYQRILTKKSDDPKRQESQEFSTTFTKVETKQVDEKTEKTYPVMVEVVEEGKKEIKELSEKKLEYSSMEREVGEKIEESKEKNSGVNLGAGDESLKGEGDEKRRRVSEVEKIEESKEESLKDETDEKGEEVFVAEKIEESKEGNGGGIVLVGEESLKDETDEKGEQISKVEKIEEGKGENDGGGTVTEEEPLKGEEAFESKVEKIEASKEENDGGGVAGEETSKGESEEKGVQVSVKEEKGEISPKEEDGKTNADDSGEMQAKISTEQSKSETINYS